jgi:hypothetical protein
MWMSNELRGEAVLVQSPEPRPTLAFVAAAVLGFGALVCLGYPTAWLLWSLKSPLHSTTPEYVYGFGAGAAFTLGLLLGAACGSLSLLMFVRLLAKKRRKRQRTEGGA